MTVAELIQALSRFDPQKDVVIRDADTSWWLNISVEEETDERAAGVVALIGGYGNEYEPKP